MADNGIGSDDFSSGELVIDESFVMSTEERDSANSGELVIDESFVMSTEERDSANSDTERSDSGMYTTHCIILNHNATVLMIIIIHLIYKAHNIII